MPIALVSVDTEIFHWHFIALRFWNKKI